MEISLISTPSRFLLFFTFLMLKHKKPKKYIFVKLSNLNYKGKNFHKVPNEININEIRAIRFQIVEPNAFNFIFFFFSFLDLSRLKV